jgi:hypothetical protein
MTSVASAAAGMSIAAMIKMRNLNKQLLLIAADHQEFGENHECRNHLIVG